MKYKCYLCQHEWEYEYSPQYRYIECPNCGKTLTENNARKAKDEEVVKRPDRDDPLYTVVLRDNESVFKHDWYIRDLEKYIDFLESRSSKGERI